MNILFSDEVAPRYLLSFTEVRNLGRRLITMFQLLDQNSSRCGRDVRGCTSWCRATPVFSRGSAALLHRAHRFRSRTPHGASCSFPFVGSVSRMSATSACASPTHHNRGDQWLRLGGSGIWWLLQLLLPACFDHGSSYLAVTG